MFTVFVIVMLAAAAHGQAAEDHALPPSWDLDELVAFALATHPSLQVVEAQQEAAVERVRQAGSLPDPMFMWGEMIEGPSERMLSLSQSFPWPGTLAARQDGARSIVGAVAAERTAAAVRVAAGVQRAWARAAWLAEMQDLLVDQRDLARGLEASVRAAYEAGTGRFGDLLQSQVEVARRSDRLDRLAEELIQARSDLNAALGREATAPLELPRRLGVIDSAVPGAFIDSVHPSLTSLDRRADALRHESIAARRSGRPALSLGVDWVRMREKGMASDGAIRDAVRGKLGLSLPLWRGKYDGAASAAEAQVRAVESQRHAAYRILASGREVAVSRVRDADRRRGLYERELLPLAGQAYETALAAYRADGAGFAEVLTAQRSLLDLQEALLSARRDKLVALADLDEAVGRLPPLVRLEPRSGS